MTQDPPGVWLAQPSAAEQENQRRSPRRRVLKEGKVIIGQSQSIFDCTIDNISAGGAHIRISSTHGVPDNFYLAEVSARIIHKVEVAWRTTTGMGLRLVGAMEDGAARDAFLRKFRRG